MANSLAQRIEKAYTQHRIWINQDAEPFPCACCWCGSTIDLDYSQGFREMTNRLSAWLSIHEGCLPKQGVGNA